MKLLDWALGAVSAASIAFGVGLYAERQFVLSDNAALQDDVKTLQARNSELEECKKNPE